MTIKAIKKVKHYEGILLEAVDAKILGDFLDHKGITLDVKFDEFEGDIRTVLIDGYLEWFKKNREEFPNTTVLECTKCGADSVESLPSCAVCGDEGVDEEVVVADESTIEVLATVEDLNSRVSKIKIAMVSTLTSAWETGRELCEIEQQGLYKLRKDGSGMPVYRSFNEFVIAEIGISERYKRNLMAYSATISKEDFERIGPAKITLIAQVTNIGSLERARLLEKAREGTSLKELRKEAEKILPAAKPTVVPSAGAVGGDSAPARNKPGVPEPRAEAKVKDGQISMLIQEGSVELKIKQGTGKNQFVWTMTETLVNGIVCTYSFDTKKKIGKVTRTRTVK